MKNSKKALKNPKTMTQFKADPRVQDISDERGSGDGIWLNLRNGFMCGDTQTHSVHEDTVKECSESMKSVHPCACSECIDLFHEEAKTEDAAKAGKASMIALMKASTELQKKSAKGRTLAQALNEAVIVETGADAITGEMRANLRFADGKIGGVNYEVLRQAMVRQGEGNRALLQKLGYKVGLVCVAGLFGSAHYEKEGKSTLAIEGAHLDRIVRLGENGAKEELTRKELQDMMVEAYDPDGSFNLAAAFAKLEA